MKNILSILFILVSFQAIQAQSAKTGGIDLKIEDVEGRWIEGEQQIIEGDAGRLAKGAIYLFKEDLNFHKGSDVDGVIIFAVAGRYLVKNDSIKIAYFDFTTKQKINNKPRRMSMKVLSITKNEMKVDVRESRYIRYTAILRKQKN